MTETREFLFWEIFLLGKKQNLNAGGGKPLFERSEPAGRQVASFLRRLSKKEEVRAAQDFAIF